MKKLGLPFEYQRYPELFDPPDKDCDVGNVNNLLIECFLTKFSVKTVLDMTCGTGRQLFFLKKFGYQCTGSDFSPRLLEIARNRAKHEKANINFIDGDMRHLKVGQFDAVITMDNAIGHLTKSSFAKAIRNIHSNLKDGGIYIFDIFNLEAMTDQVVADFQYCYSKIVDDSHFHKIQFSTIDRKNGFLTSYDHFVVQKKVGIPKSFKNKFTLQLYTAKELKEMLTHNGFDVIGQYDMNGRRFSAKKSINIFTVAKKQ